MVHGGGFLPLFEMGQLATISVQGLHCAAAESTRVNQSFDRLCVLVPGVGTGGSQAEKPERQVRHRERHPRGV